MSDDWADEYRDRIRQGDTMTQDIADRLDELEQIQHVELDANRFARAWLSVALAASKDEERPALDRTVCVEFYEGGVRLVATDSYIILHSWVPVGAVSEPGLDEVPLRTAAARDPHGRARALMAHLIGLTSDEDSIPFDIRLTVGPVALDPSEALLALDGLCREALLIDVPDKERLKLDLFEGDWVNWRPLFAGFTAEATETVVLNPERLAALAKLAKYHGDAMLAWEFGGTDQAARVHMMGAEPSLRGLVMPVKTSWDGGV